MKYLIKILICILLLLQLVNFVLVLYWIRTADFVRIFGQTYLLGDYLLRWPTLLILFGGTPVLALILSFFVRKKDIRLYKKFIIVSIIEIVLIVPLVLVSGLVYTSEHGIGF